MLNYRQYTCVTDDCFNNMKARLPFITIFSGNLKTFLRVVYEDDASGALDEVASKNRYLVAKFH